MGVQADSGSGEVIAPLPRGWTYLIHGTDTGRSWDLAADTVRIGGMGLSAITLEDAQRAKAQSASLRAQGIASSGYDTTKSYSHPTAPGVEPVEIRIAFLREDLASNRRPNADVLDVANWLPSEMRRLATRYHRARHAVVPRNETLIKLGNGNRENGRLVAYYVPQSAIPLT